MQDGKQLKFETPQFPIIAAPAVKLVCSNDRTSVNANREGTHWTKAVEVSDQTGGQIRQHCYLSRRLQCSSNDRYGWYRPDEVACIRRGSNGGIHKGCVVHPATNKDAESINGLVC